MRLEDTDRERFVAAGVEQIVEALDWLGLKPDEGFWINEGKHQNVEYVQSERQKTGLYQKYADQLVTSGLAYYSPTSAEELETHRSRAKQEKKPFLYKKSLDSNNSNEKITETPIRFDVSAYAKQSTIWQDFVEWEDAAMGHIHQKYADIDDFIIIKSDGFPTYNFANVVDDHDMKITHVLRGQEFVSSTPKHLMLYDALKVPENEVPVFVHLPVINGTDGKKLSKRTGDTDALDYREKGYLPGALLNFLSLLGWNDGTEQEIFTISELEEKFSLDWIGTSSALFDQKRLDWISGHHIRELSVDDLFARVKEFWPAEADKYDNAYKKQVLGLVQERMKYFAELPHLTSFFFKDMPIDPGLISSHKQLKKFSKDELKKLLEKANNSLEDSDFSQQDLTDRLNDLLESTGQKPVVLFSLLRIATTQAPASPGLAYTLAVLGKTTTLRRLRQKIDSL